MSVGDVKSSDVLRRKLLITFFLMCKCLVTKFDLVRKLIGFDSAVEFFNILLPIDEKHLKAVAKK